MKDSDKESDSTYNRRRKKKYNKKKEISDSMSSDEEISKEKVISKSKESDFQDYKFINIKDIKNEITIILNLKTKNLQFLKQNEVIAEIHNINVEKSLSPAIFLYGKDDVVLIEGFS